MAADRLFLDTNVLLAATVPARKGHEAAQRVFLQAPRNGVTLLGSGQVLREYLAVATRPLAANGLGLDPHVAAANADVLASRLEILPEDASVAFELRRLVRVWGLRGRSVFDANLVAMMRVHAVADILTDDPRDLYRFESEVTVHPLGDWSW
jgi:predicted nucleic acid-binding protein